MVVYCVNSRKRVVCSPEDVVSVTSRAGVMSASIYMDSAPGSDCLRLYFIRIPLGEVVCGLPRFQASASCCARIFEIRILGLLLLLKGHGAGSIEFRSGNN